MELIDYLTAERVEDFNTKRSQRSGPDLFAADLAGKKLPGVDLASANLEKADLSATDLSEANLMRAQLSGIDGSELKLTHAMGLKVKMREAWLEGADLTGADFTRGDFTEACLKKTKGKLLRLLQASLKDAEVQDAEWEEAELCEATFTRANFSRADLRRADLTEARGNGAVFTEARLDGVVASSAKFAGAQFQKTSLVGARLDRANLSEADLTGADLAGADLSRANLHGAILTDCVLQGACLADAGLDGVDFTGVDLTGVDLTGLDPKLIGLSEEQIQSLSAYGAGAAAELPVRVTRGRSARLGDRVAMIWVNADEEDEEAPKTFRWAVCRAGKRLADGVLSIDAESVLSHHVIARADAFELLVLREGPGGVALLRYPLGDKGVGGPVRSSLGYAPLVVPVVIGGAEPQLWGIARRGPTVVRSEESTNDEGEVRFSPVWSARQATAQGFFARHHPVLKCKGDVLIPLGNQEAGKPLRTPSGFSGRHAQAVPCGEDVLALWVDSGKKGGVRYAMLKPRAAPESVALTSNTAVMALDAYSLGDQVLVVWLESDPKNILSMNAFQALLPFGEPKPLKLPEEPDSLRIVAGSQPALQLDTLDQGLLVCDLKGKVLGSVRPE